MQPMSSPAPSQSAAIGSPHVVTVKLLKPDSGGHMQRVFLQYATPGASSAVEDSTLFRDEFNALLVALMGTLPPDAVAATEVLFQVRWERVQCGAKGAAVTPVPALSRFRTIALTPPPPPQLHYLLFRCPLNFGSTFAKWTLRFGGQPVSRLRRPSVVRECPSSSSPRS